MPITLAVLASIAAANAAARDLDSPVMLDIAAAPLESALLELSKQTGMQLVAPAGDLPVGAAPRISGNMSLGSALNLLLQNTDLTYRLVGDRTLTIIPKGHEQPVPMSRTPVTSRVEGAVPSQIDPSEAIRLASRVPGTERSPKLVMAAAGDAASASADSAPASNSDEADQAVVIRGQREGTAEQGYRAKSVSQLGALGAKAIEDTPFSINVVPPELIENRMATAADQLFRINPVAQLETPQARFYSGAVLRGFSVGWNSQIDGMRNGNNADIEDKERIEIITGLSAFLYGLGNVGGTVNYVLKRPTEQARRSLSIGNTGGDNYYAHLDLGGPIDRDGRFGYRLNVVGQDGDTYMDHQSLERTLVSAAFDWNLTGNARLQLDGSFSDSDMRGGETYWLALGSTPESFALYSDVPDTSKYYGQPQSFTKARSKHLAVRYQWQISDASSLRAAVSRRTETLRLRASLNALGITTFDEPLGPDEYQPWESQWTYPDPRINSVYLFADTKLETGRVHHRFTGGFFGDEVSSSPYLGAGWLFWPVNSNVADPLYFDEAPLPPPTPKYTSQKVRSANFVVGDEISIGRWTALLGVVRTGLKVESFSPTGEREFDDSQSKVNPAATLMWRATDDLRLYANYMTSFEQSTNAVAPALDGFGRTVVNAGQVMSPIENSQLEIGAKYSWGGALFTAALFDIDKALEVFAPLGDGSQSRLVQDGRQVHRGAEVTVSGRLTPNLTLVGGVTLLDAKVKENSELPALEGSTPVNVAEKQAKLYAEYGLPALRGLTLTAGVYHTGKQELVLPNSYTIDGFTTVDLGVRYGMKVWNDKPLVLRLNVNNVTDEQYWLNSLFLGYPRTYAFGAQLQF